MEYQLKYTLEVLDSKYREFLNVLERKSTKEKPNKCTQRKALQSISDMNMFEYLEVWTNKESLEEYLQSNDFKSLQGAFQLLTSVKKFAITESSEIEFSATQN